MPWANDNGCISFRSIGIPVSGDFLHIRGTWFFLKECNSNQAKPRLGSSVECCQLWVAGLNQSILYPCYGRKIKCETISLFLKQLTTVNWLLTLSGYAQLGYKAFISIPTVSNVCKDQRRTGGLLKAPRWGIKVSRFMQVTMLCQDTCWTFEVRCLYFLPSSCLACGYAGHTLLLPSLHSMFKVHG